MRNELRVALHYSAQALFCAVRQAANCYTRKPAHWRKLVEEGMSREFSGEDTARGYADLYQKALEIKRGG